MDTGDEENTSASWRKTERFAANDGSFRPVWGAVEKLWADADMQARRIARGRKQRAALMAISFAARVPVNRPGF